jgi:hypothetical protein
MREDPRLVAFAISASAFVTLAVGCNAPGFPPQPAVQPVPIPAPPATAVIKVVPAQTPFSVELTTPLSSSANEPGEPFRARVLTPLASVDGDTIVTPDAEIVGRIMAVAGAPEPSLFIRFDAIETRWGPRVIGATFTRAQPDPSVVGDLPRFEGYDGALEPAAGIPLRSEDVPATADVIELPAGARLRIVLTYPLAIRALEPASVPAPSY